MRAAARIWVATAALGVAAVAVAAPAGQARGPHHLVACAPGYPGSTLQAQSTMDQFATMVSAVAGWPAGSITAEYRETEEGGVERLVDPNTTLALVPVPFLLKHEEALGLRPIAQVVQENASATQVWSLVAAKGRVSAPADLEGWELSGIPAYAPSFIRGPALGQWGRLPSSTTIVFSRRMLRTLRRVSAGDDVAVVLDSAQAAALAALPNAGELEIVTTSPPLPAVVLVTVGDRVSEAATEELLEGMLRVHQSERFVEVLETLRVMRFETLDLEALTRVRAAYRAAR